MKPLFMFNKWRGINDRVSERDLPDVALVKCENWEIDESVGDLILGKGYSEYYADDLGGSAKALIVYKVLSDGDARIFLVEKSNSQLVYFKNDGAIQTLNFADLGNYLPSGYGTILSQSVYFTKNLDNVFGGIGNIHYNVPFWFGHIEKDRFRNVGNTAFEETLNDFYFLPEECAAPEINDTPGVGTPDIHIHDFGYESIPAFGLEDTFTNGDTLNFNTSLIYENGQESYLSSGESGIPSSPSSMFIIGATNNQIYFQVSVKKTINPRCVGMNIWMRVQADETPGSWWSIPFPKTGSVPTDYKLVKTLWFDETESAIRDDDSLSLNVDSRKHLWEVSPDDSAYWRCYMNEDTGNPYQIHVTYSEWVNSTSFVNYFDYELTPRIMPNYTIAHIWQGVKYVAKVKYPPHNTNIARSSTDWQDTNENTVYYSVQDEPNVIPETNFISGIEGKISGIGNSIDRLLILTEENLNLYYPDRKLDKNWSKNGCVSHPSIITIKGVCYWAGRDAIYQYDRFFPEDISSFSIYKIYKAISLDNKRKSSACYDEKTKEYVLTIPNYGILKYNVLTKEWTTKTTSLIYIVESSYDNESYGITDGAARKVVKYNDGYSFDGSYYTATAKTKPMVGQGAENIIKSLIQGYCQYVTDNDLTIQILVDGIILDTILLEAQTTIKPQMFGIPGNNGENVQLIISLTTSSDTTQGQVGFVKLWGEIHDIMGDQ